MSRFWLAVLVAWHGAAPALWAAPVVEEKAYRITAGDVVSITVYPVEEYSREVTVQPDGKVELALLGAVLLKGLTSAEAQEFLQKSYARYVASPRITVNIRRFAGRRVAILGEIRAPGYYEFRDGMKLLELVSLAGGMSDSAKASKIRILRPGPSGNQSVKVNFKPVLAGHLERDPPIRPGDTIYIPKQTLAGTATWLNISILPWLSLAGVAATIAILADR